MIVKSKMRYYGFVNQSLPCCGCDTCSSETRIGVLRRWNNVEEDRIWHSAHKMRFSKRSYIVKNEKGRKKMLSKKAKPYYAPYHPHMRNRWGDGAV